MASLVWSESISHKLSNGALPRDWPVVAGGNWGTGYTCAICERVVDAGQVEVHALFRDRGQQVFHVQCFVRWWRAVSASESSSTVA